jgi:catecholate siderophore receptor
MKQSRRRRIRTHHKAAGFFGSSRTWLAAGTLAAYAAAGSNRPALAATVKTDADPSGAATLPVKRFDIPAGPLEPALAAWQQATGRTAHLVLPPNTSAGFQTQGVHGLYPEDEALRILLAGTGLTARTRGDQTIVSLQAQESVTVNGTSGSSVSLERLTEPLIDTPQSVSVVPQFVLHDQGATTLRDSLRNVPGISLAAGEGGSQGDNLTIRGFSARNDIFLDGIRDFGSYYRDGFNYDQVEALEGPAGIEFGRGTTGGVINQVTKVPQADQFIRVDTQFGTDRTRRISADVNVPVSNQYGGVGFRANVVGQQGGVAGRHGAEIRRSGVAAALSVGRNAPTRATLAYEHLSENDTPDYGLPWLFNHVAPADRHSYYGFVDENYLRTDDDILTLKVVHDFKPELSLRTIARGANYPRNAQITEPQLCSNPSASVPVGTVVSALPTMSYNTSLACVYDANTPADEITKVNRNQIVAKSVESILWDQTDLSAHFSTRGIRHHLTAGVEGGQEISNPIRSSYVISKVNTVPTATLLDPNEHQTFSGTGYITSVVHTKSQSFGAYFLDTLHIGHLIDVSGGVRWDYFNTDYNLYQPTAPPTGGTVTASVGPISRLDKKPSYRAALVYKPTQQGSVYFAYGTSFNPAAESLSLSVGLTSSTAQPEENENYEGGAKWSFLHDNLLLSGAVFRTEKDNARETDPTNSNNIVAAGNQVVRGVQFSAVGRLPEGMDLIFGYAYLDSEVISSKFFPAAVGYPLANVPKQTVNAFVTHRLPLRLVVGVGGNYVGSRTASSTVPYIPTSYTPNPDGAGYVVTSIGMKQIPGYWVFNAMLRRPITDKVEFQINVNNLLNRYYIDLPHPSHLIPGPARAGLFAVNFHF